jgi:hypothetical protein
MRYSQFVQIVLAQTHKAPFIRVTYEPYEEPDASGSIVFGVALIEARGLPSTLGTLKDKGHLSAASIMTDEFKWSNQMRWEPGTIQTMFNLWHQVQEFRTKILERLGLVYQNILHEEEHVPKALPVESEKQRVYLVGFEKRGTEHNGPIRDFLPKVLRRFMDKGGVCVPIGPDPAAQDQEDCGQCDAPVINKRTVVLIPPGTVFKDDPGDQPSPIPTDPKKPDEFPTMVSYLDRLRMKGYIDADELEQFEVVNHYQNDPVIGYCAQREEYVLEALNEILVAAKRGKIDDAEPKSD